MLDHMLVVRVVELSLSGSFEGSHDVATPEEDAVSDQSTNL